MSSYKKCDYCGNDFSPEDAWEPIKLFYYGHFSLLSIRSIRFEDTCPRCQKIIIRHIKRLKCAMKRRGKK